jgi:hypothetical protein
MGAGDSARDQARRLREAAAALQRKAAWAARRADDFEAGGLGETAVAEALAPISAKGWYLLHDRLAPMGGNIDHLAVGPAGVAVIDAKRWTEPVTIEKTRLLANGVNRTAALEAISRQVAEVKTALAEKHPDVKVRGFLALAAELDLERSVETVGEVRVVGLRHLPGCLQRGERLLSASAVESVFRVVSVGFPPAEPDSLPVVPPLATPEKSILGMSFDTFYRVYYIRPWRASGARRLYLKAEDGTDLGWKDTISGSVTMTSDGADAQIAAALLKAATEAGTLLPVSELPRLAAEPLGSKLLGKVTRAYIGVLVGQEWRKGSIRRMYGRLIDPMEGHFELGYVDLVTGQVHPAVQGELNKNLGTAQRYLERLRDRNPPRTSARSRRTL